MVKEFLAIKKNIRANELAEKTGKIELQTDLSEFFKPVTETQKTTEITEGLEPIRTGIEQSPQGIAPYLKHTSTKDPFILPPDYSFPLTSTLKKDDYDTEFGVYKMKGALFMGNEPVDAFIGTDGNHYINIGDNNYLLTEGLYYLLALKDPPGERITANDFSMYRRILALCTLTMIRKVINQNLKTILKLQNQQNGNLLLNLLGIDYKSNLKRRKQLLQALKKLLSPVTLTRY